jgi:hypothetical protein
VKPLPNLELPGMAPDVAGMVRRLAAGPHGAAKFLKRKPTEPCDIGLFSDDAKALDLVELARAPAPAATSD